MIPRVEEFMMPIMVVLTENRNMKRYFIFEFAKKYLELTSEQCQELIPGKERTVARHRFLRAMTLLKKSGLVEVSEKIYSLTEKGITVMESPPKEFTMDFLADRSGATNSKIDIWSITEEEKKEEFEQPHDEVIDELFDKIQTELKTEIIKQIMGSSPEYFEKLVVALLLRMGYGYSETNSGIVVGKTNDGGIDGLIKEDRLGLDVVYIQAKRWKDIIGRPAVQAFSGSLDGKRAKKGVFITTSKFTKSAKEYVENIEKNIALIDGDDLAELMIEFQLGVKEERRYILTKIDMPSYETS